MALLSIIIPTFNSAAHLKGCIESIMSQTYQHFEILIQDGGSTDGTIELVNELRLGHSNIHLISERDTGIYDAMNRGMARAKGDWFYFLGSDDRIFSNDTFELLFSSDRFAGADLIYGNVLFKNRQEKYGHETSFYQMLKEKFNICHQAIFYSRKTVELIGTYRLDHPVYADYDYNLRCFKNTSLNKQYVDQLIALFNEEGISKQGEQLDNFYSTLLTKYVIEFEDPAELYLNQFRLKNEIEILRESRDFKIGRLFLSPIRKIKRLLKS